MFLVSLFVKLNKSDFESDTSFFDVNLKIPQNHNLS